MRKLLAALFLSLAIELSGSEQYIYPPGDDSPIQHWSYPTLAAMNTDTGLYGQDVFKIAFNKGDGNFYYLADPSVPTWLPLTSTGGGGGNVSNSGAPAADQISVWVDATHIRGATTLKGGTTSQILKKNSGVDYDYTWAAAASGGSTTFIGLTDVPAAYTGAANKMVTVNGTETALVFSAVPGGGNVSNSGVPTTDQTAIWTDATHVKGVTSIKGGTGGQVLSKNTATDYDWVWVNPVSGGGGGTVTNVATTAPILGGPITVTGTISLDPTSKSNWDSGFTDRLKWDGGATGLVAATGRTSLGLGGAAVLNVGSAGGVQAWDADLDALGALTGTNTIYYRSAANTWSAVAIGSNMTFSGGTLNATVSGGGGGDFSTNTSLSVANEIVLFADASGKLGKRSTGSGIATLASGVLGTITDNSANWNTAFAQNRQWDGGGGAWLTPATARTTLQLNAVTNDTQTQSAIMPNTLPGAGFVPVGNAGATAYVPRAISGSGATISLGSTGILSISSIPNTSLANSTMTITGDVVSLGGSLTLDQITGVSTNGYLKRTGANLLTNIAAIPNTDLAGNTAGWDTASAQNRQWDGGSTGLVAATGRTSLALNNVTNDAQAKASIYPNNVPTAGQLPVGHSAGLYFLRTVTGGGATVSVSENGVFSISNIASASMANDSVNVTLMYVSGTYTTPAGVRSLWVEAIGGGGGGAGCYVTNVLYACGGGGGGGGGWAGVYISPPAASYTVTIGAGGAGGPAASSDAGSNGGTTSFGTAVAATGGGGATATNGGYNWANVSSSGGFGGTYSAGMDYAEGSDGENGWAIAGPPSGPNGTGVPRPGSGGAAANRSGTSKAPYAYSGAGQPGARWGGGGSGAACNSGGASTFAGGSGFQGYVLIYEIY